MIHQILADMATASGWIPGARDAEVAKLKGQRAVLCSLLRSAGD